MNTESLISTFMSEMETYQSNHYGYYDRNRLVNAYNNLPDGIKKYLTPAKKQLLSLWRGCDGLSETRAISFTSNKNIADLFGTYIIPFKELAGYQGLIDSGKASRLSNKLHFPVTIGDDEDEVIVINPKWNNALSSNLRKYLVA